MNKPLVHSFFDEKTNTISYIVADPVTREAAIIDSVLDFDLASGSLTTESADAIIERVKKEGYTVVWILETHAHADHITAAQYLKKSLGGKVAIGEQITEVQTFFAAAFHLSDTFHADGRQFDKLWKDGETFQIGSLTATVIATPGHTPADVSYLVGDALFVGDTVFMPDHGTARCDFPGGSAETLYDSIHRLYALPDDVKLYHCHDYLSSARTEYRWESSLELQKMSNIHVANGKGKRQFVEQRLTRDATLGMPKLIIPSLQINIRAGQLPDPEENGMSYLKIPVNGVFSKQT